MAFSPTSWGMEKEMATHSSVLAWRVPGMGEPGGLPSMGSHRVRHDWSDLAAADGVLKIRDVSLPTKVCLVKAMVFPVVMYGSGSWTVKKAKHRKNWCFWTVVLEKTLDSLLDCKEIQPVHPKGDQSWVFTGRTDVEAETPILWPPDAKSWLIGKDSDPGKDWGQEEKKSWVFFPEPWFPEPWFPEPMLYKPDVEFIKYYMWKYWKNTDDT